MANKSHASRVILPPKKAGKIPKAVIERAVSKVASELWQEKLGFLQEQEALAADPAQKSALKKQIKEVKAKIEELNR
jgi:hypothetical protein